MAGSPRTSVSGAAMTGAPRSELLTAKRSGSLSLSGANVSRERLLARSNRGAHVFGSADASAASAASFPDVSWTAESSDIREGSAALGNLDLIEKKQGSFSISSKQTGSSINNYNNTGNNNNANFPTSSSFVSNYNFTNIDSSFDYQSGTSIDGILGGGGVVNNNLNNSDVPMSPSGLSLALRSSDYFAKPGGEIAQCSSSSFIGGSGGIRRYDTLESESFDASADDIEIGDNNKRPLSATGLARSSSAYGILFGSQQQQQQNLNNKLNQVLTSPTEISPLLSPSDKASSPAAATNEYQRRPSRSQHTSSTQSRHDSPHTNNNGDSMNSTNNDFKDNHSPFMSRQRFASFRNFLTEKAISPSNIKRDDILKATEAPFRYIPAVLLGLLMNILDGVSYGLIMFPTNSAIFSGFGGIGVSMFLVSCIACQLICTTQSIFRGGNGSMMIEIVPFLHVIAFQIQDELGLENADAVISTTLISFALSSILTGIVFFLLGYLRMGILVEFFPRHILVGCIGGVGAFLFLTGFEVSARLHGNISLELEQLKYMLSDPVLPLWAIPFGLSLVFRQVMHTFAHPLIFPSFFVLVPIVFYCAVLIMDVTVDQARDGGWIFPTPEETPWYEFYRLLDFKQTSFAAILKTVPTQLALVFFAILHVPINVPSVALSIGEDNVDTDKELVNHGLSNFLSGVFFSVPNYLCYVNSVLFYKMGGDSRLAGFMLACATTALLLMGPWVIGYIPVMVVGILIFILGIDLMKEAVYDTWGRVSKWEYVTIWIIIITMTAQDFVAGIGVGIIIACGSFVVTSSRRRAIRTILNGETARSTVRRHPRQDAFLRSVGAQTRVLRLQGFIFFGTTSSCENTIREIIKTASTTIRYLVLDFTLVSGIDFSAAESFLRVERICQRMNVVLVLCGCGFESSVGQALRAVNLWTGSIGGKSSTTEVFETLNSALEHCENSQLQSLYSRDLTPIKTPSKKTTPEHPPLSIVEETPLGTPKFNDPHLFFGSPRRTQLVEAARETLIKSSAPAKAADEHPQPYALLRQAFLPYDEEMSSDLIMKAADRFERVFVQKASTLWILGQPAESFYAIESGILRALYPTSTSAPSPVYPIQESMLPGTVSGEQSFLMDGLRSTTVIAERDCVLWKMSKETWNMWEKEDPECVKAVLKVLLRISAEEQGILMGHLFTNL